MVKYPAMRENGSSTYYAEQAEGNEHAAMGYSLCMLHAGGRALNGYYRDPYLLAISRELEDGGVVEDKWFTGYETEPRRLPADQKRRLRSAACSQASSCPAARGPVQRGIRRRSAMLGVGADNLVPVPQVEIDGLKVDTVDRIQLGSDLVRHLTSAGL